VLFWEALPDSRLRSGGEASAGFIKLGVTDYRAAGRYVRNLRYGRTATRDPLAVLREGLGTCSTKHALLAMVAREQSLPVELALGIYLMSERNTPGVGQVLEKFGIESIPEAHCYLRYEGSRIDVTRAASGREPIDNFLREEIISPAQIGEHKMNFHQRFLRDWMSEARLSAALDFPALWRIREDCIAALSLRPS
jgi:hypothetical protein